MNFFGVGPLEFVVVMVVALIFIGPERLPRLAADIARTIREVRKYTGSLATEFNEVVKEFEAEAEQDRAQWKEIGEGLSETAKSVSDSVQAAGAEVDDAATAAATPPETAAPTTNGVAKPAAGAPAKEPQ